MLTENAILGFVDLRGQRGRATPVGVDPLHQPAVRFANFRLAGVRLKPQDLISFLRAHTARTRRRALPLCVVSVDVLTPSGMRAVEITFKEP